MKRGDRFYVAYPDEVQGVSFVEDGDGGRNFKRRPKDPVVVVSDDGEEFVMERAELYSDLFAAGIASAEKARKIDEEG